MRARYLYKANPESFSSLGVGSSVALNYIREWTRSAPELLGTRVWGESLKLQIPPMRGTVPWERRGEIPLIDSIIGHVRAPSYRIKWWQYTNYKWNSQCKNQISSKRKFVSIDLLIHTEKFSNAMLFRRWIICERTIRHPNFNKFCKFWRKKQIYLGSIPMCYLIRIDRT